VPLEIRPSPFGRGLFAAQAVAAGQPVYEATRYGIFRTESEWRRFLALLLPASQDLWYDIVLWSYVLEWTTTTNDEGGCLQHVVAVDLDEGSLMNHGAAESSSEPSSATSSSSSSHGVNKLVSHDESAKANVRYCADTCHYVATRNIAADEEILCDYSSFHVERHSLEWYDKTWDEIVGTEDGTTTTDGVDTITT